MAVAIERSVICKSIDLVECQYKSIGVHYRESWPAAVDGGLHDRKQLRLPCSLLAHGRLHEHRAAGDVADHSLAVVAAEAGLGAVIL